MTTVTAPRHLGPIELAPGVRPRHAISYLLLALCLSGLVGFIAAIQPYVFNEILHVPRAAQGRLTGNLQSMQQMATLVLVTLFGLFVDRLGRRPFLILGAVGITAVVIVYPVIPSIVLLFAMKLALGVSTTAYAAGGATMMMDLPSNGSRGKFHVLFTYVQMLCVALIVGFIGVRLPTWLAATGMPVGEVHVLTFWIMACFGVVATLLALFLVKKDPPVDPTVPPKTLRDLFRNYGRVVAHARRNLGFRVLMITSFATRADGAILQSFLILWIVNAGHDQGIETKQAMIIYGNLQILLTALNILLPPVMGWLADRMNRAVMLLGSLLLTSVGFAGVLLVHDITGRTLFAVMAVITIIETMQNTAVQTLMGQEAPAELRGSAYGLINFCGTLSVVVISFICGYLYDKLGYTAPFIAISLFSLTFGIIATAVYILGSRRARRQRAEPALLSTQ